MKIIIETDGTNIKQFRNIIRKIKKNDTEDLYVFKTTDGKCHINKKTSKVIQKIKYINLYGIYESFTQKQKVWKWRDK